MVTQRTRQNEIRFCAKFTRNFESEFMVKRPWNSNYQRPNQTWWCALVTESQESHIIFPFLCDILKLICVKLKFISALFFANSFKKLSRAARDLNVSADNFLFFCCCWRQRKLVSSSGSKIVVCQMKSDLFLFHFSSWKMFIVTLTIFSWNEIFSKRCERTNFACI